MDDGTIADVCFSGRDPSVHLMSTSHRCAGPCLPRGQAGCQAGLHPQEISLGNSCSPRRRGDTGVSSCTLLCDQRAASSHVLPYAQPAAGPADAVGPRKGSFTHRAAGFVPTHEPGHQVLFRQVPSATALNLGPGGKRALGAWLPAGPHWKDPLLKIPVGMGKANWWLPFT